MCNSIFSIDEFINLDIEVASGKQTKWGTDEDFYQKLITRINIELYRFEFKSDAEMELVFIVCFFFGLFLRNIFIDCFVSNLMGLNWKKLQWNVYLRISCDVKKIEIDSVIQRQFTDWHWTWFGRISVGMGLNDGTLELKD